MSALLVLVVLVLTKCKSQSFTLTANLSNITNSRVNKYVFGINNGGNITTNYTISRLGGETQSRYNWKLNSHNSCKDWYFLDEVNKETWQAYNERMVSSGVDLLTQIPAMGWVAKSTQKLYSFSQKKYGQQQKNECTGQPPNNWCEEDAGNGIWLNGSFVVGNDFNDANEQIYPSNASDWIQAIIEQVGTDKAVIFEIDNEPGIWHKTHHDCHPIGCTYDELVGKLYDYGPVIKKACNNQCKLMGPTVTWCAMWTSGYDGQNGGNCYGGPDQEAHGGLTMTEYYLQAARNWSMANGGQRLLDYYDVHWYPAGTDVTFSCAEDANSSYTRLQSPRTLYDWNYQDPTSWITRTHKTVALLPRLNAWINEMYPGTMLSVSEFNFGGETCITSAMAHAEVLAIYAKYRVSLSTRWGQPESGSLVEDSYKLYVNYDGKGSNLIDTYTVDVMTSHIANVTGYGFVTNDNKTFYVIMFNKNLQSVNVTIDLKNSGNTKFDTSGVIDLYGIDKDKGLNYVGTVNDKPSSESFVVNMPSWTVRMAILTS